jgi:DNA-binding transcriptional ArsR family regulator
LSFSIDWDFVWHDPLVLNVPPPPPQVDALAELFGSSRREFVPIRKSFVQLRGENDTPLPGPLASIVRRGVPSALDQFLLLHARAAGRVDGDEINYEVGLSARVWARLLGLTEDQSGRRTVGRNWKALVDAKLVTVRRVGRQIAATPLRDDGGGELYSHPKTTRDRYLKVPYAFWLDGHAAKLKLPGLALALIACSTADWFPLPFDRGPSWYGIGTSTVERGLRELRRADLIEQSFTWRKTALSDSGWTKDMRYRLLPPLGPLGVNAKGTPDLLSVFARPSPSSQADSEQEASPAPHASGDAT